MRRWTHWNWTTNPDDPSTWTDATERLVVVEPDIGDPMHGDGIRLSADPDYGAPGPHIVALAQMGSSQAVFVVPSTQISMLAADFPLPTRPGHRWCQDRCPTIDEWRMDYRSNVAKNVIPAAIARTQTELDAVVPELVRVSTACRALWLEPTEEIDVAAWLQIIKPIEDDPHATFLLQESVRDGAGDGPRAIDWVIVRGTDKPLHPAWVRRIRDDCKAAGVPFAFLSWGEWVPSEFVDASSVDAVLDTVQGQWVDGYEQNFFYEVGAERSGRELDGVVHDDRPEAVR